MLGTLTSFRDGMHIDDPAVQARTIFVDTAGVRSIDFDLDDPARQSLYESGRSAAAGFLSTWDFEQYTATYRS